AEGTLQVKPVTGRESELNLPKSIQPLGGPTLTPEEADELAPAFFSKLERVASEKVPTAASGDQILATLRNNGVKESEIAWTGVDDFLKGKPKVLKSDLQQYITEHKIQLEEVSKGGANAEALRALKAEREKVYAENNRIWSDNLRYADGTSQMFNEMNEGEDV